MKGAKAFFEKRFLKNGSHIHFFVKNGYSSRNPGVAGAMSITPGAMSIKKVATPEQDFFRKKVIKMANMCPMSQFSVRRSTITSGKF